jgi:hypothetical protein
MYYLPKHNRSCCREDGSCRSARSACKCAQSRYPFRDVSNAHNIRDQFSPCSASEVRWPQPIFLGFILGGAVAHQVSAGFVPIRKKGKLPHTTVRTACSLEYGLDEMEMHADAIQPGERVSLVDDLIATGGTAGGAVKLLRQIGSHVVAACFIIDLSDLGGGKIASNGCTCTITDGVRGTLRTKPGCPD